MFAGPIWTHFLWLFSTEMKSVFILRLTTHRFRQRRKETCGKRRRVGLYQRYVAKDVNSIIKRFLLFCLSYLLLPFSANTCVLFTCQLPHILLVRVRVWHTSASVLHQNANQSVTHFCLSSVFETVFSRSFHKYTYKLNSNATHFRQFINCCRLRRFRTVADVHDAYGLPTTDRQVGN